MRVSDVDNRMRVRRQMSDVERVCVRTAVFAYVRVADPLTVSAPIGNMSVMLGGLKAPPPPP